MSKGFPLVAGCACAAGPAAAVAAAGGAMPALPREPGAVVAGRARLRFDMAGTRSPKELAKGLPGPAADADASGAAGVAALPGTLPPLMAA